MNKFRFSCFLLALGGMIMNLILPDNISRPARAEEMSVTTTQANKDALAAGHLGALLAKQPVEFEENRGQLERRVRYQARGTGYSLFLTADEAVYVLPMPQRGRESRVESREFETEDQSPKSKVQKAFALRMKIVGANTESLYRGEEIREHRTNYFKGDNPENWQTEVPNYSRVVMQEVYKGVSMVWHGKEQGATQYDFVVEPNGDADQIALEFDGAERIELDAEGNLLIHTEAGTIKQTKPFTYQETGGIKQEVESGFAIENAQTAGRNSQIRFSVGEYDRSKPLTIDPYSTYLGGNLDDAGYSIAIDATGNIYVTGSADSTTFPTTAGAFDTTQNGGNDVFVTKLNAAGSALIYSTFIGGSGHDVGFGIAVDSSGNAFLTGMAQSADYPTTAGAYDTIHNGNEDVFVTKLNAAGSGLIYSTFVGGSGSDYGRGIAFDSSGNAFLTGFTYSSGFPTTVGAFDTGFNNGDDVFAAKLNAAGSSLIYSTFLGGQGFDEGNSIAVDSSGNAFLTGFTQDHTTDYPATAGAYDTTHNGFNDVFVTKLNAAGSALIYSTFIGGASNNETGRGIAVDSSGNAFLTGFTGSTNYPATAGAYDITHNGQSDVFVTKLNPAGTALIYSTFIGGNDVDDGSSIVIDSSGNAFLTGSTYSTTYPTTAGGFDTTHNGQADVFVTKLNAAGSALTYSSFIGGSSSEFGYGIAFDTSGNAFVTGQTNSSNFPITAGAYDTTHNGFNDGFVSSLSLAPPTAASVAVGGRVTVGANGLARARVTLTDINGETRSVLTSSFGYYRFNDVAAGETYILSVSHKRYAFAPQVVSVMEEMNELNFTGD
ncbi:MAG TPA: SBBP repeat-containing protein [Pyrinomonadaceae bacterium]|jgi:hypothetical protein